MKHVLNLQATDERNVLMGYAMGTKPNQRIALIKELIHRALIALLKEQDIHKISIRELCGIAGINRTTFYNHYGSQYDVLAEMEQVFLNDVAAFLFEGNDQNRKPMEQVLRYLESNLEFVRLLFNSNVDPEFPRKLFSLSPIQQTLQRISAREALEREQDDTMSFLLYGGYQIVQIWINKDNDRDSPEWMAEMIENLMRK